LSHRASRVCSAVLRLPTSTLSPYTTLFRSLLRGRTSAITARALVAATGGFVVATFAVSIKGSVLDQAPLSAYFWLFAGIALGARDRKSTRLNSSHRTISYAVFCLKKKKVPN